MSDPSAMLSAALRCPHATAAAQTAPAVTLELLSPWALEPDMALAPEHRAPVRQALVDLLQALREPSAAALGRIEIALAALPPDATQTLALQSTHTPLAPAEVEDYDRYFGLRHVDSQMPGLCLVRGLLIMVRAFVTLCERIGGLDARVVELQKDGLRCHARLLARVFDLEALPE